MSYNPEKSGNHKGYPNRRSIRLKGYDYSQAGLYFITICVQNRECLFGKIENDEMILNDAGKMVEIEWLNLKNRFPNIELHKYVAMPNHFHGILEIVPVGAALVAAQNDDVDNEKGQPQGIASTVRVSLVDTQNDDGDNENVDTQNDDGDNENVDTQNDDGDNEKGQPQGIAPTKTIGDMMDAFKSITTVEYIRGVKNLGWQPFDGKLWQRNYYEHIIRNKQSYQTISNYIINNPAKWQEDKFHQNVVGAALVAAQLTDTQNNENV